MQTTPWKDALTDTTSATEPAPATPLSTPALLVLIAKLPNLRTFHWAAPRLPPAQLCLALGTACKSLALFIFELPCSTTENEPGLASPIVGSATGPTNGRWDALDIASLPLTLTSLSLGNLSHEGAKALGGALSSFPSLEELELGHFPFVDDELLGELAQAGLKKLRRLVIKDMTGTRLTENGLQQVLSECEALKELVLDNVEGKLSSWLSASPTLRNRADLDGKLAMVFGSQDD